MILAKRLWSVFTDDMDHCYYTGSNVVERHHIFGGAYKNKSEKRGFIIPLRPDYHPNGVHYKRHEKDGDEHDVDTELKQMAQIYYEEHYGTREEFIAEFGKSRL